MDWKMKGKSSRPLPDYSQQDLLRLARDNAENDRLSKIKTIRSDNQYPWPTGKAPWSKEKGGTGVPPDEARENYGNKAFAEDKSNIRDIKVKKGPVIKPPDYIPPPEDDK